MLDDADSRLDSAAAYFREGEYAASVAELRQASGLLAKEGAFLVSSVSAKAFQTPVFSVVTRIFSVFDTLPDTAELSAVPADMQPLLPRPAANPEEMLRAVAKVYEQAEEEEAPAKDVDFSIIQLLHSLLTGQQSMRDVLFADEGMYDSAAASAAPYLAVLFTFSGDEENTAAEKAAATLFGPIKHLAELFYSLLTSSLTAGLLLLAIRRVIPVLRPSKASAAAEAVLLAASAIPDIISGLRTVSAELSSLRQIIRGAPHGNA